MALEQEIKLVVTREQPLAFSALPLASIYQQGEVQNKHLITTYFDTPHFDLMTHGYGLRLRFDGENWLQTVKESGHVANGLHQRQEWEHVLLDQAFDLTLLQQTPLQKWVDDPDFWTTLSPVFTTEFDRQYCVLETVDQTTIELAYDRGRVYTAVLEAPIHEVELELKSGQLHYLTTLAQDLCASGYLQANDRSKAQQGYELASRK